MNPLLKPCFVRYCSRKVVNSIRENLMGNAKEYYDTLIRSRYRINRGYLSKLRRDSVGADF